MGIQSSQDKPNTTEGDEIPVRENPVNLGTQNARDDESKQIDQLRAERDSLAAELAARTEQLRAVLHDLHNAHLELSQLRGESGTHQSTIDWHTILHTDPLA